MSYLFRKILNTRSRKINEVSENEGKTISQSIIIIRYIFTTFNLKAKCKQTNLLR